MSQHCSTGSRRRFHRVSRSSCLLPPRRLRPQRRRPCAAISRDRWPRVHPPLPRPTPMAFRSLTKLRTGRRPRARACPRRSMRNTDCNRSLFPALRPIPPHSCNRRRWRASRRRSPAINRFCQQTSTRCCRTPNSKPSSMRARRTANISAAGGRSMRPGTASAPRPPTPRTRSVFGAASCSATARAPARVASPPASSSTTGFRVAARPSGFRSPTS